jgi:flagellar biosynthesis protein FlhF
MLIKRFEAKTMAEALALVRVELGPDAIVLGTKTLRRERSRFGLFAQTLVEVTAGVDRDALGAASGIPNKTQRAAVDPSWKELKLARALVEPIEAELRELRAAFDKLAVTAPPASFAEELATLRALARGLAAGVEAPAGAVARFRTAGISALHCPSLARDAERIEREGADRETAALASLALRVEARLATPRNDGPHVRMLIGAAGVGKTTTAAKLAARAEGKRVRIVTTDLGRRGELERLKALASELDVRFSAIDRPDKLAELARKKKDEWIVIDTPSSGRRGGDSLACLARIREALGAPHVQLVVSATTKESDLRAQLARHAALAPDSLAVTNWDESTSAADLVNVLLESDAPPLALIASGPRVPEDLELPDSHALARAVLQGAA